MRCSVCQNEISEKKGEIDLRIEEKLYIARNVVYEQCAACGVKVLSPQIAKALFERVRKGQFVEEALKIPVLDGTYG
jgi:YgiT-type zinc finger domain-containing protein